MTNNPISVLKINMKKEGVNSMSDYQSCIDFKKVGANIDKEHSVFNLIFLVELFFVFQPAEILKKRIDDFCFMGS